MLFGKSLSAIILLMPLLEIATFVLVASQIGVLKSFGLLILGGLAGVLLLRHAGRSQMNRLRAALAEGGSRIEIKDLGLTTFLAGVLLLIPGFLTDVLAILLLIPPVRRMVGAALGHVVVPQPSPGGPTVVDLDQDEWRRVADAELPPPRQPLGPDHPADSPERGPTHKGYQDRP